MTKPIPSFETALVFTGNDPPALVVKKQNRFLAMEKPNVLTPEFAHLVGYFVADGSFYMDDGSERFEFMEGSPEKWLDESEEFLKTIHNTVKKTCFVKGGIRKRGNAFVLSFRSKFCSKIFYELGFKTGKKAQTVDIPEIYRGSKVESYFWQGVLDGDGTIALGERKITLEVISKPLSESFKVFLEKNGIEFSESVYSFRKNLSYAVRVNTLALSLFAEKIGFQHPRKKRWLEHNVKLPIGIKPLNAVYPDNFENRLFDEFFRQNIMVVNGKALLAKYRAINFGIRNKRFRDVVLKLKEKGLTVDEIQAELCHYSLKMGKGSKKDTKIPALDEDLINLAKTVRLRTGGIHFKGLHGVNPLFVH